MIHFFDLPREVRDLIYEQYVSIPGGYVLGDFEHNTLKGADGTPIDLSLMRTCKAIAREMKGVALASNTLNFSTFYSEDHRTAAGRFDIMINEFHSLMGFFFEKAGHASFVPDDVWAEMRRAYPMFGPYIDVVKSKPSIINLGPEGSCGETPSVFRSFIQFAMQTITSHEDLLDPKLYARFRNDFCKRDSFESGVNFNVDTWIIPTAHMVEDMGAKIGARIINTVNARWECNLRCDPNPGLLKHRYSAAAVAIRFFESLAISTRSNIRRLVLHEDRQRFCYPLAIHVHERSLYANVISYPMAIWIVEALELERAGMPLGSFRLIFEGDRSCTEIFQDVVQRDAAWQRATDLCVDRGHLPPVSWEMRRWDSRARFLEPVDGEGNWAKNSIISCNFDLGTAWDAEQVALSNKGWTADEWSKAWLDRDQEWYEPNLPSPSWTELLCDNSLDTRLPWTRAHLPELGDDDFP
ncbi:hypothetical protein Cob_v003282 [Colletotrichum orbiculare MAFF 240422]|uniref:Uncharacterized protein n=1 Tax=Colletotrichum orbiculare (strain 104-T / ATCC 96160 / CBS 514.97 / LARS 414 / MAFF 240422) TaxID=1213857 RepID=A0A484G1F7_COLOR|nr:hypothetical protein Cob_v003282 [Colletotrichum orbiculare MAFF 240422]